MDLPVASRSFLSTVRAVDFSARCRDDAAVVHRGRCAGRSEEQLAMNKWVLAAVLATAALAMYISIFVKVGG